MLNSSTHFNLPFSCVTLMKEIMGNILKTMINQIKVNEKFQYQQRRNYIYAIISILKEMILLEIKSVSEYIGLIEKLDKCYPAYATNESSERKFIFRGQGNATYKLLPGVLRKVTNEVGLFGENEGNITNYMYAGGSEKKILNSFIQEASCYINRIDYNDHISSAELAQHYGVPTRFLDWTFNPLIALYFACIDNPDKDGEVYIVHALNYNGFRSQNETKEVFYRSNKKNIETIYNNLFNNKGLIKEQSMQYPLIYLPKYIDGRMVAQSSVFMVWGNNTESFEDMIDSHCCMKLGENHSIINFNKTDMQYKFFYKIKIRSSFKQFLFRQLDMLGINAKTVYPGLEGIGKSINKRYLFNYNESVKDLTSR